MDNLGFLDSILSDIGNFALVIFGFTATLFTVLYSFILGRREQLKEVSDRIKQGEQNPIIYQRQSNAMVYIKSMKNFNVHLIIALISNLVIYVTCMGTKYFLSIVEIKKIIVIGLAIAIALILVYVVFMLIVTIRNYISSTKI